MTYLTFSWASFNVGRGPPICPLAAFDLAASVIPTSGAFLFTKGHALSSVVILYEKFQAYNMAYTKESLSFGFLLKKGMAQLGPPILIPFFLNLSTLSGHDLNENQNKKIREIRRSKHA